MDLLLALRSVVQQLCSLSPEFVALLASIVVALSATSIAVSLASYLAAEWVA